MTEVTWGKPLGLEKETSVEWVVHLQMPAMEDNVTLSLLMPLPLYIYGVSFFLHGTCQWRRLRGRLGGDSASGFCLQRRIEHQAGDLGTVQPIHSWLTLFSRVSILLPPPETERSDSTVDSFIYFTLPTLLISHFS